MEYELTDISSKLFRESFLSILIGDDEIEFLVTSDEDDTQISIINTDLETLNKHEIPYSNPSEIIWLIEGQLHDDLEDEVTEAINAGDIY